MESKKVNKAASKVVLDSAALMQIENNLRLHETDVGSPEVQIIRRTGRILGLNQYLQQAKKDYPVARRIVQLVSERKRLLEYLKRKNNDRYLKVISALGLRR